MHIAGYVHLDIKPDNILIAREDRRDPLSGQVCLIDFGIAKRWRKENGDHVEKVRLDKFCGNVLFASCNAYLGYTQSRRDDLIAVAFLLCFLIAGEFRWLGDLKFDSPSFFKKVQKIKIKLKVEELCTGRAACLLNFCKEAMKIKFREAPNYQKLKHLLRCALLERGGAPDEIFDWSKYAPVQREKSPSVFQLFRDRMKKDDHEEGNCLDLADEGIRRIRSEHLQSQSREQIEQLIDLQEGSKRLDKFLNEMQMHIGTHLKKPKGSKLVGEKGHGTLIPKRPEDSLMNQLRPARRQS